MNGFKAYQIDTTSGPAPACHRGDYYTLYLLSDQRQLQGAGQEPEPDSTYLLLGAPSGEASSAWLPARQTGYACLFTEAFVQASCLEDGWEPWQLLNHRKKRVFSLQAPQAAYLTSLFEKMLAEQQSTYLFKHELLRSYLHLLLLELMRQPTPKRVFRFYTRLPGPAGVLVAGWLRRLRGRS